jgi:hypothetical protein
MSANGRRNVDDLLATALAGGATYREAAKAAHVSERTVRRRMEDEAFRGRVADERAELVRHAARLASGALTEAVTTLVALMRDAQGENVRLAAARSLLSFGTQAPDSLTSGLRRHVTISKRDHEAVIDGLIKIAIPLIPEELHARLWATIDAWVKAEST